MLIDKPDTLSHIHRVNEDSSVCVCLCVGGGGGGIIIIVCAIVTSSEFTVNWLTLQVQSPPKCLRVVVLASAAWRTKNSLVSTTCNWLACTCDQYSVTILCDFRYYVWTIAQPLFTAKFLTNNFVLS